MVNLHLDKRLFTPKFFPLLLDYTHRFEFYMGSAGSAKSYFITQKLIIRAINEPIRILVCRRYGTTIRNSVFSLFKEIIAKWKLTPFVKVNESDFRITFLHNNSEILFTGLDDETKLLSLNNIGCVFVEEVFECDRDIVEQLNLRMRGKTLNQQILMAWNPISQNHWLYDFAVVNPPENSIFIHSTYKDNPFLSKEYISSLEELYTRNPAKARIYCDGEWGIDEEGLVFTNWHKEEFDVDQLATTLEHRVGSDLGYKDPTTIICSLYDKNNRRIYVYDEFYKTGQQLDQVAQAMTDMNLRKSVIWMDAAEPRSIDFFRSKGFNVKPCLKGADSVEARILFLQNNEIIISPKCQNTLKEFENFSYIKDKKTNKYSDKMTHEFSHAIDGLGYAYSNIYMNNRLKSIDKSILGI